MLEMSSLKLKADQKYNCTDCDKPYVKKGALTNHMKNIHGKQAPPAKKEFLDNTTYSDLDKDETMIRTAAQAETAKDFIKDANLTELEDGDFNLTINHSENKALTQEEEQSLENWTNKYTKASQSEFNEEIEYGASSTIRSMINGQLEDMLATISEESPEILLSGPLIDDQEVLNDKGITQTDQTQNKSQVVDQFQEVRVLEDPQSYNSEQEACMCDKCGWMERSSSKLKEHIKSEHNTTETDSINSESLSHNCADYNFNTDLALNLIQHDLDEHVPKGFLSIIRNQVKPIDPAMVYILAEQNLQLAEEIRNLRKSVEKQSQKPISEIKVKCSKCPTICTDQTCLEEHMKKEHTKNKHKLHYVCTQCNKVFRQRIDLHKHIELVHKPLIKEPIQLTTRKHLKCFKCDHTDSSEEELTKHFESKHSEMLQKKMPKNVRQTKQVKCPLCSYQNRSEENVITHVEDQHPDKKKCPKCNKEFTTNIEFQTHTSEAHNKCDKCNQKFLSQEALDTHVTDVHVSKAKVKNTLLIADSLSKYQNPRIIEKSLGGRGLYTPGFVNPRTGRAYCSTRDWPNSRYPENNLEEKVMEQLSIREHSHLIFSAPCNDISNIGDIQDISEKHTLAIKSSENCIAIAERALRDFPKLEKVIIPERLPRADHLADLSEFSNFVLRSLAEKSELSSRITVAPMEPLYFTTEERMSQIFGSPYFSSFDGIHPKGKIGKKLLITVLFQL